RQRSSIDMLVIDVFSGASFVVADVASWLGKRFGKPIVMVLRGGALPQFISRHPRWTMRVLSRAGAIIAPSEFLARVAAKQGLRPRVIPNVIDLSVYPYRHRRKVSPRLFWMRSFHSLYNPSMAVRVVARLRSLMPDASLVMAGLDKGLQSSVRQLADEMGLNGTVRFPGVLDTAGKAREGDAADIFLITNRVDNMPVTAVEACAMGIPVIATAVGGIPDLLKDGETGLLVPDDNDEAMAEAIRRLVSEPGLAERLSANGRSLAERSSWEQVRPMWEEVFAELMKGRAVKASPRNLDR
ncbi:MAG TPA: glycosyltransferase family 4 protein, partial [Blastocatellia bacterium]|nr:glycosyltransferase family 4 protein [Blastocatellia bacterium]